ncbi:FK506-binding protein 15-like isoform X2 [Mercenaria mercenaria]|uniref:FK506-binding protein 15-like isoform X2 n=1 Tax=Mercenaria mercenaria TaxID=6596 RepID=UPI00234E8DA9|nr:FK506-binding protein 15-like isoform X2 [Mercenaria mercenaria]
MMKRKASVVTRVKWTLSLQHFEECGQGSSRLFLLCPLLAFTILTKMESPYIQFLLGKSISSSLLPTYVCQVFILRHLQFMYALSIPSTQGSVNSTRIPRYGDLNHVTRSVWSSKLGALFGMDKAGHQGGNESLTYTAPKQPKKKESTPAGKGGAPAVIFAVAVNAYKYVDNKYASQGKLGAAILANHVSSEYSVLMYVSQQQKITTAKITSAFAYTIQANNYANFYDDVRQSWSLLFENEQNATDFAKYVCLAKALSTGATPTGLVTQDLMAGEGGALQTGDSVEVKYTGKLLTNNTFGQVFDSNVNADKLFRFKLGAGKVIKAWDTGVVGMKKGGKRFLVAPPNLAYGSQGMSDRIPANATLLFEIEIVRVKLVGRESSPTPAQPPPQPMQAPPPATTHAGTGDADDFDDDSTVKERTKSITEQLTHSPPPDTSKAKLISRMAKMGKPMLPLSGAVAAHPDSEDEHVPESPVPVASEPVRKEVHRPVPKVAAPTAVPHPSQPQQVFQQTSIQSQVPTQPAFLQNIPGAQQMAVFQPQQNFLQQQQQQASMMQSGFQSQIFPNQSQQAVPGMSQGTDMMLLSETRQQNTEVRLSLSKMSDKVDQVLQKIDQAHSQTSGTAMLPNMETSLLLHNITRIVQENERLKKDVFEKSGKIESQNEKISELLQRNQSFVEKSQVLMEQRNEGLLSSANQTQHKVLSLEQEKVELTKQLSEATSQISALQLEVSALKKKEFDLSQQLESGGKSSRRQSEELENLKTQHAEDESVITDLQRQLKEEKHSRKSVESSLSQLQEEMSDLQEAKRALEKNVSDRKRKAAEERRQLEDEMEDVKANFEAEIQSLKEKLRKQKTSVNAASQEQISQLEEEINKDWQGKSDRLLAVAAEKHNRALQNIVEEKQELETKVEQLENRIQSMRNNNQGSEEKLQDLQEQVEQLSIWKEKYESLRNNATTMKERYEEHIEEIETQRDHLSEQLENVQSELKSVRTEGSGSTLAASAGTGNLLEEVKKIMNTVYKEMRDTFESEEKYTGSEILAVILNSIKSTTLSLMKRTQENKEDKESEEEEEESEEEEEEEESDGVEDDESTEPVKETVEEKIEQKTETQVEVPEINNTQSDIVGKSTVENSSENHVIEDDEKSYQDELDNEIENVEEGNEETSKNVDVKEELEDELSDKDTQEVENEQKDEGKTVIENPSAGDSNLKKAGSLEDLLDSALESKTAKGPERVPTPIVSTEPPPLSDDSSEEQGTEKDRTKSIFDDDDDDDNVAETLGITNKPVVNGDPVKKSAEKQSTNEEDMKPKPPPPLFGDDDDDDDLDWLS